MREKIKEMISELETLSLTKPIKVISHNDTDGITSAAIFSRALQRWNKHFSLEIVKNLEKEYIKKLPDSHVLIFLDLASGSLPELAEKQTEIFILDHHEIPSSQGTPQIPKNIRLINPLLSEQENIAASAICYMFAKTLSEKNKDLSTLAVIGMIGDMFEKHIGKTYSDILKDSQVLIKKGLLLYPATRPIDRVLENSFSMYIPGVTGSFKGVLELLRDSGIEKAPNTNTYKSIAELTEEEMSALGTSIMLRNIQKKEISEIMGNIFLIKFFNRMEDARELSALINACSRMDCPETSLGLCLGNKEIKKEAEKTYTKYRKTISSALGQIQKLDKISGKNYTIINAQDKIKDTIIGTIASIMSFSSIYPEGTVIITMAYNEDKIKVSARLSGRKGRNVREVLHKATIPLKGEVGGHPSAAGCLIPIEKETQFIENLQKTLDIEVIKV